MNRSSRRCLYCMDSIGGKEDFHPRCSRIFFGSKVAPLLEYGLAEMENLAAQVIRTHAAIPGVQAKISLDWEKTPGTGKARRLTLVGLWGAYILKPPTKQYPSLPEVEAVTMGLADVCGISTVPHALIRLQSGELAYLTQRVDRRGQAKIAMEDMCQLTGRLTEDKYKGSMEQVGRTIRQYSTQPGLDAVNFFELALFCFLTGNADMHLKNFSLWRPSRDSVQLAPAYDLVATKLLLAKDKEETALTLNGKKKNLRRKDFDALAHSLDIPDKARDNAYAKMFEAREQWGKVVAKSFLTEALKREYRTLLEKRGKALFNPLRQ